MMFYKKKNRFLLLIISIFLVIFLFMFKCLITEDRSKTIQEAGEVFFSVEPGFYEESFELEMTAKSGTIYYTLDGSVPDKNSIKYEKPVLITDATNQDNMHSMRTDVSTGFEKEEIEKISSDYPGYQVPDYKIDKATIVRAVVYDGIANYGKVKTASYFVGFGNKNGYEEMNVLSMVTDPSNLFDYETGIYVTGKTYDEYVKEYRGGDEYYWREEFWALWMANYRNRGKKWEREVNCQFFDTDKRLVLDQESGIRIHGGISRGYNPKSLNVYARKEYSGNKQLQADLFKTGYYPSAVTLFQGGNDVRTKLKDYVVATATKDLSISTMNYEPYILFLNGEYWGIYWLNEKYNAEYFEHYYGVNRDNVIIIKSGVLEDGDEDDIKYYSKMVEFCAESDVTKTENYEKVCDLIDIDSYIDYCAVMLYIGRSGDWPDANYCLWRVKKTEEGKYGDAKWRWAIYDLNSIGFSNDMDPIKYYMDNDEMFRNLMTNSTFRNNLILKIEELSNDVLDYDTTEIIINNFQNLMTEPMRENDRRFFGDDSLQNYYGEIDNIKKFFESRKEFLTPILKSYI